MGAATGKGATLLEKTGTGELGKSQIGQFCKIILERGSTAYRCTGAEKDKECLGKLRIMPGAKERKYRLKRVWILPCRVWILFCRSWGARRGF